jgi:hypothetical protein
MKNVKEILTHIKYSPEFKKINTQSVLLKLIDLLPFNIKKGVAFAYTKNQTLFFVVTHPVYKMEFKYNETLIRDLLKKLQIANIEKIECFVTNRKTKKDDFEYEKIEIEKLKERSHGIFDNNIEDKELYKLFEEIREVIKK